MSGRRIPQFVKVLAPVVVVLAVLAGAAAWYISDQNAAEQQHECEQSVQYRNDTRSMWVYLLATRVQDPNDPKVVAFEEELNRRLPELRCVDRELIPVNPQPDN